MTSIATHATGSSPDVLHQILDPGLNLSLWQRPAQRPIVQELSTLHASNLQEVRRPTSLDSFDGDVSTLMQQQRLDPSDFENLRADLRQLANLFSKVSEGRDMIFRLLTTDRDNCQRFHLDRTHLRLMCTYRGPGTEWLADAQVDRVAQARGAPNEAIIRFGEPSHFETFWVGILRGDPDNVGQGLVHRSPAIARDGQIRVFFCLDC